MAVLFDQRKPMGRLAAVHILSVIGDGLVTISLAGSLFFSISPDAAKSKVLLYLLVTMAPFAVVAPVLGPLVDRSAAMRRVMVAVSTGGRALLALLMAGSLRGLVLFPEAFTLLVLSRLYALSRATLVPLIVAREEGADHPESSLANGNARLAVLASVGGALGSGLGVALLKGLGASWVLRVAMIVYICALAAGFRLPRFRGASRGPRLAPVIDGTPQGSAQPAGGLLRPGGPRHALWMRAFVDPEVTLALNVMSVLRGTVGFFTFMVAFDLRRGHASTLWYGFALLASGVGAFAGVILVPRLRRHVSEQALIAAAVWLVLIGGVSSAAIGGRAAQALLAFVVGIGASGAQPVFDAVVQRYVPQVLQGRAFARFQTRLQLSWVAGSIIPVILSIHFADGDMTVAAVAGVSGVFYLAGRHAVKQRPQAAYQGAPSWHEGLTAPGGSPRGAASQPRVPGSGGTPQ